MLVFLDPRPRTPDAPRRTDRMRATLSALAVAAALVLSACSGVTTATRSPDADAGGGASSGAPDAVAYAQCMRDNGIPGFPDPDANGDFAIDASALGVSLESAQYTEAEQACASLLPARPDSEQRQEDYDARLAYAQCMREHGLADFPDPIVPSDGDGPDVEQDLSGGQQSGNGGDVDPTSEAFVAANDACKQLLPAGDEGPSLNGRP